MDELTDEVKFHRAIHRLAEVAWDRMMTVEALLALAELLNEPPTEGASSIYTVEL